MFDIIMDCNQYKKKEVKIAIDILCMVVQKVYTGLDGKDQKVMDQQIISFVQKMLRKIDDRYRQYDIELGIVSIIGNNRWTVDMAI